MLKSLQSSREFFREMYGSIIYCCDEHHLRRELHDEDKKKENETRQGGRDKIVERRIRDSAARWWDTYARDSRQAVHAFVVLLLQVNRDATATC